MKRTAVIEAIEHKQRAYVPWHIDLTSQFSEKAAERYGCGDVELFFENHLYRLKYKKNRSLGNGNELDLFGVTWQKSADGGDVGNIVQYPVEDGDFSHYKFPEVDAGFAKQVAQGLADDKHDRFRMFGITMCMFERLWSLRGMEDALVDMLADEDATYMALGKIEEHHTLLLDTVLDYDFEGVYFGDDWGQQRGLIMGPVQWRKYIKPVMSRLFQKVKSKGKYVILHSCGDLREIMGDLVEMGLDVYNTVQPEIYDLPTLKREYGKDLTFYGGISTQQFLPFASADECADMAKNVIEIMAKDGGYILSATHAVTPDIPVENVRAMVDTAKKYAGISTEA